METGLLKGLPSKIVMLIGVASVVALSGYLSNRYDQSQVTPKNTAFAADLKKGVAAARNGDFVTALRELEPLAEQGNVHAQDLLGVTYENGEGVTKDYVEAVKWYRKAAEKGNVIAQNNLGYMYANGKGVTKDEVEAVRWYRKAADQGDASAQNNLGVMCYNGKGVPQDDVEAYKWYSLAAAQGHERAKKNIETIAGRMTAEQIAEAQKRSANFKPRNESTP